MCIFVEKFLKVVEIVIRGNYYVNLKICIYSNKKSLSYLSLCLIMDILLMFRRCVWKYRF